MGIHERKEREKEQRRHQIILTAEELFLKNGVDHTTMDQIANVCEISRGTLYLYFKSKEELVHALILHSLSILFDSIKERVDVEESAEKQLEDFARAYLDFFKNYRNHFVFIANFHDHDETTYCKEYNSISIMQKNEELWRFTMQLFQKGKDQGYFKDDINPLELALIFWSASNGVLLLIDHIMTVHNGTPPYPDLECVTDDLNEEFSQIDYQRLINKMWDMLIFSIRK